MALSDRLNGVLIVQWLNKITDSAPLAAGDPHTMIRVVATIRALWHGDYHGRVKILAPDRLGPGRRWARRTHLGCGREMWSSPELATYRPCATCLRALPRRSKPLKHVLSSPVTLPRWKPWILCASASPLSGRQHAMPKLGATALGPYKLSVPSGSLGNHTPNAPAHASDYPPECFNLGFPPNRSRTPSCECSPWLARYRSVHDLLVLVSTSLCAVDAYQPGQLN
jgi:hypothetical protein